MSQSDSTGTPQCVSCGIQVSGMNAAQFSCPDCGASIYRCAKCRKQSNLYECHDCGFRGP
ncbi:RNA-binding protein [Halobacteriales archaeon SW_8_68_21]|nr:MAG: RNA-binding protein [Halobacteriales archaeon SW_8_68_21]